MGRASSTKTDRTTKLDQTKWHEDSAWKGWWGDEPPFHTPVFVLTHHPHPSIEMKGGTTFHFLEAAPAEALETARHAASGLRQCRT